MSIRRTARSYGNGRYYTGENDLVVVPRTWKYDQSLPGVVYLHGRSGSALDAAELDANSRGTFNIVNTIGSQYPVIAADLGGQGTWGHPNTQQARTADAITYLRNVIGCSTDPVMLVGTSMGGLGALNFAANNRSQVAGVAGIVPVVSLEQVRQDSYGAEINAVWGMPSYVTPLPTAADPTANYAALSGLSLKMWYSSGDTIVKPNTITNFASLMSNAPTVLVGTMEHQYVSLSVDPDQVLEFVSSILG